MGGRVHMVSYLKAIFQDHSCEFQIFPHTPQQKILITTYPTTKCSYRTVMRIYGMNMPGTIDMVETQILREQKGSSIGYDTPLHHQTLPILKYLSILVIEKKYIFISID